MRAIFSQICRWVEQPRFAIPILIGLAVLLRLPNLTESLWFDEVVYSTLYRGPSEERLWRTLMRVPGPPLYLVWGFYWAHLFGESELIVRLPSLVCGLGSVVLTYLIARRFVSGGAAFLAGIVLCFSPAHVWYSQEATPYAMTMFFLLVAVYVWPRVSTLPFSVAAWEIYVGALMLAVFTHYYAAVFLAPFTILAVTGEKDDSLEDSPGPWPGRSGGRPLVCHPTHRRNDCDRRGFPELIHVVSVVDAVLQLVPSRQRALVVLSVAQNAPEPAQLLPTFWRFNSPWR